MSPHRALLFAFAALFTAGLSSAASACCGWGAAPVGCGGCAGPTAAAVFAQPVAPAPPPVFVSPWACGCACGCRGIYTSAVPALEPTPIAAAPIYVVNQGPDFTGPGIMVPFHTWAPTYPYPPGYGCGGCGYAYGYHWHHRLHRTFFAPHARFAYRGHFYGHPFHHHAMPAWHPAMRRHYH